MMKTLEQVVLGKFFNLITGIFERNTNLTSSLLEKDWYFPTRIKNKRFFALNISIQYSTGGSSQENF